MIIILIAELLKKQNTCNVMDIDNQIMSLINGTKLTQLVFQRGGGRPTSIFGKHILCQLWPL